MISSRQRRRKVKYENQIYNTGRTAGQSPPSCGANEIRAQHELHADKTVAYEELVRQRFLAEAQGKRFADDAPIDIIITAFLGIPKSASKRKQMLMTSGALFPMKKPDLDNVMKIVCDALNGIAYKDDAQIVNAKICKRWSSEMPSVWVTICGTEREGENDERKEV